MIVFIFLLLIIFFIILYKIDKSKIKENNISTFYNGACKKIFLLKYNYVLYSSKIKYTNSEVVTYLGMYPKCVIELLDDMLTKIKFCVPSLNKNSDFQILSNNNFIAAPVYKIKYIDKKDFDLIKNYKIVLNLLYEIDVSINFVCLASGELYYQIKDLFPLVFNYDFIEYDLLSNINAFNVNKGGFIIDKNVNEIQINDKLANRVLEQDFYLKYEFPNFKICRYVDMNLGCMIYTIEGYYKTKEYIELPIFLTSGLYQISNINKGLLITDVYNKKLIKVFSNVQFTIVKTIVKGDFYLLIKNIKDAKIIVEYDTHKDLPTVNFCIDSYNELFKLMIKTIDPHLDYIFNYYLRKSAIIEYIKNPFKQFNNIKNMLSHKKLLPITKESLNKVYLNRSYASYYYSFIYSKLLGIYKTKNYIVVKPSKDLWLNYWEIKYKHNNETYTIYLERNKENKSLTSIGDTNIHNLTMAPINALEKNIVNIKY